MTSATKERKRLTPKQHLFVEFVALGRGYSEAARAAGYDDGPTLAQTASALAHKPHVASAITRAREHLNTSREFTTDWWRAQVAECIKLATESKDMDSRLRALDMAAKHIGVYVQQPSDAMLISNVLAALTQPRAHASTRVLTEATEIVESETGANGAGEQGSVDG